MKRGSRADARRPDRAAAIGLLLLGGLPGQAAADALADLAGKSLDITYAFTSDYEIHVGQPKPETLRRSDVFHVRTTITPARGRILYRSSTSPDYGDAVQLTLGPNRKVPFEARPGNPRLVCKPACQVGQAGGSVEVAEQGQELVISTVKSGTCRCAVGSGTSVFTTQARETVKVLVQAGTCTIETYSWSRSWRGVSMTRNEQPSTERATQTVTTPIASNCSIVPARPRP